MSGGNQYRQLRQCSSTAPAADAQRGVAEAATNAAAGDDTKTRWLVAAFGAAQSLGGAQKLERGKPKRKKRKLKHGIGCVSVEQVRGDG